MLHEMISILNSVVQDSIIQKRIRPTATKAHDEES
jgi:uncharacterized protein (UPF0147 family)